MSELNNELAPIALFAFKRLPHLRTTVEALAANGLASSSSLYVFCDGPRSAEDEDEVSQVREYVDNIEGFARIDVTHQANNLGPANSIVAGVSKIVDLHGKVIVVEDDIVTSPYFLGYMNDGLSLYANVDRVGCIHGYTYPTDQALPETFFLRGADIWGWATWKRAWAKFVFDPEVLIRRLEKEGLASRFDLDGAYGFTELLRAFSRKENSSWDACWHASAFLENMLTLYPAQSLVRNIGFDNTGTHCSTSSRYDVASIASEPVDVKRIDIEENQAARAAVADFFRGFSSADTDRPPAPQDEPSPPGFFPALFRRLRLAALKR